jgi:hypothetical protein
MLYKKLVAQRPEKKYTSNFDADISNGEATREI